MREEKRGLPNAKRDREPDQRQVDQAVYSYLSEHGEAEEIRIAIDLGISVRNVRNALKKFAYPTQNSYWEKYWDIPRSA
jgi:hypothetical protein